MSAHSKGLSLPEVVTPGCRPPLAVSVSVKHTVRLKRRPVPPLLTLPLADLSPYMHCRSLKNSPRGKGVLQSHRKTSSVMSLGNSPTATARAGTPEIGVTSNVGQPRVTPSPHFNFQPFQGKLEHFRQLFDQIIEQNSSCAPVLEAIRSGYEEVIRQAGLETLRNATKPKEDPLDSHLCEKLIEENRQLSKQASCLRKQLRGLIRENSEFRQSAQSKVSECSSPLSAAPRAVPKLDMKRVPTAGFQEEFMALADVFSQSWRDAIKAGR